MDKDLLLKPRLPEVDVELPGVGTVRVRGLSRSEAMQIQAGASGQSDLERRTVAFGMVDPALTEDEVEQWRAACTVDEFDLVANAIIRLSGMDANAPKEAYKSPGDGSDAGV